MKAGSCNAATIAKRVRVIKRDVTLNARLSALIDQLWALAIVPHPMQSVHLDAELYVLEVSGQDNIRVSTDDRESPIASWMNEVAAAANSLSRSRP